MPGFEVIGEEERAAVNELFDDGGILFRHGFDGARNGRYRAVEFERAFADWMGVPHALAVSSGTAALTVALRALGVGPGDEVITQAFTFVASVEAILQVGARPVVVNVDESLNMDPGALEAAITDRTAAVMPVHMLGVAADVDRILEVAGARGVPVLDDNCEALGAAWRGQKLGAGATACAFSLDFGKVITCGEGGVVTTSDDEVAAAAREYHDHGHQNNPDLPRGRDTRRMPGFNFRLSDLQAAVALAQLRKLDDVVAANRRNYTRLEAALQGIDGLRFRRIPEGCEPLCDTLMFELPEASHAERFATLMAEEGLGTKNVPDAVDWHFAGGWDHLAPALGMGAEELWESCLPTWERLSRSIALPVMVRHTPEQVDDSGRRLRAIAERVLA
jgi:8-amino-3,8-dideoxy-alpha-D-manno-octulosonate transaminase